MSSSQPFPIFVIQKNFTRPTYSNIKRHSNLPLIGFFLLPMARAWKHYEKVKEKCAFILHGKMCKVFLPQNQNKKICKKVMSKLNFSTSVTCMQLKNFSPTYPMVVKLF